MKKRIPDISTHPYVDGWSREAMTEAEETAHIAARKRRGLAVRFSRSKKKTKKVLAHKSTSAKVST
jgi:hypothetical protein